MMEGWAIPAQAGKGGKRLHGMAEGQLVTARVPRRGLTGCVWVSHQGVWGAGEGWNSRKLWKEGKTGGFQDKG